MCSWEAVYRVCHDVDTDQDCTVGAVNGESRPAPNPAAETVTGICECADWSGALVPHRYLGVKLDFATRSDIQSAIKH